MGVRDTAESPQPTEALIRFLDDERSLFGLITFVGGLITGADRTVLIAAEALVDSAISDEEERQRHQEVIDRGGGDARRTMQTHFAQLFTQIVFQRAVDNFLVYVVELLRRVFVERPEALRSSETIKVEDVLRWSTMDDLVQALVERRVERLAYLSLTDLQDDLIRSLGLELFGDQTDLSRAVRLVATRNLLAHNRAIVNERFLRQVPDSTLTIGEPILLNGDDVLADLEFLSEAAKRIDAVAISHFGLASSGA
jgi:hypothetical protein